jgi:hypothetical protein
MERKKLLAAVVAVALAAGGAASQEKKNEAQGAAGPFGLPTFASVKEKCKTSEDQNKKLEPIYTSATQNEADTRRRAKDTGGTRQDLENFLTIGRNETINKIKEVLDDTQDKTFEELLKAAAPDKKKKKNN